MCVNKRWQLQRLCFLQGSGRNAGASGPENLTGISQIALQPRDNDGKDGIIVIELGRFSMQS